MPRPETPPRERPRCIAAFRLFGWLTALAGAVCALAGGTVLLAGGPFAGPLPGWAPGAALLAAAFLLGFASAMLIGFAANLEILHDIRRHSRHGPDRG
jgi:hypothetical protein